MSEKLNDVTRSIMEERFGHDNCISLATVDAGGKPWVRTVNALYVDGSFYVITNAASNKMQQIAANPTVAICGDWFTAHGIGENLGHILLPENQEIADRLRKAFAAWYANGHTNEADPNTVILRICLNNGVLANHGTWYHIDFA